MCKSAPAAWTGETDNQWQKCIISCARSFMCDAYRGLPVHWYTQETLAYACLRIACYYQKNSYAAVKLLLGHWAEIYPERPPDELLDKVKRDIMHIFRIRKKLKEDMGDNCPVTLPDQTPWRDTTTQGTNPRCTSSSTSQNANQRYH